MKNIKNKIHSYLIKKWWKRKQLHHLAVRREENKILQDYLTIRILDGQEFRRKELVEKQGEEKEIEIFINYIKKI